MKLNIEELAREAGIQFDARWGMGSVGNKQIERFARLIVERCAQEVESAGPKNYPGKLVSDGYATAVRNLMED